VMREGVIQQADTPLATYNQPRNRFVAGFIGMPPMNFFDGAIRVMEGRIVFEEGRVNGPSRVSEGGKPPHPNPLLRSAGGEGTHDGELTLPGNGFRLMVPVHLRQALEGRVGRHVVLGIRPEHFHLKPVDGEGASSPIEMNVNVVEPLGNDMDVYMQTNLTDRVVARVEASAAQVAGLRGEAQLATFHADLRRVHFFEPGDAGMNLSLSQGYSNELAHAHA
jgi:multiple sugar transport system ATP-binding protein